MDQVDAANRDFRWFLRNRGEHAWVGVQADALRRWPAAAPPDAPLR